MKNHLYAYPSLYVPPMPPHTMEKELLDNPEQERAYKLGKLLKEWRLDLGMNRPEFISEITKHGQDMSADYLAKLESGTRLLQNVDISLREAIRSVLGKSRETWFEKTGLKVPGFNSFAAMSVEVGSSVDRDDYYVRDFAQDVPVRPLAPMGNPIILGFNPISLSLLVRRIGLPSVGKGLPQKSEDETELVPMKIIEQAGAGTNNIFAYVVSDNSMLSESVREKRLLNYGDTLYLERYRTPNLGDVVLSWDSKAELMMIKMDDEKDVLFFRSLLSTRSAISCQYEDFHIFGVVIGKLSAMGTRPDPSIKINNSKPTADYPENH